MHCVKGERSECKQARPVLKSTQAALVGYFPDISCTAAARGGEGIDEEDGGAARTACPLCQLLFRRSVPNGPASEISMSHLAHTAASQSHAVLVRKHIYHLSTYKLLSKPGSLLSPSDGQSTYEKLLEAILKQRPQYLWILIPSPCFFYIPPSCSDVI